MEVKFISPYYQNPTGYASLADGGVQLEATYHCKEVFARHALNQNHAGKTFSFLRRDGKTSNLELMKRQVKVLNVFEKKMGFEPLATCEQVVRKYAPQNYYGPTGRERTEIFFLYIVSTQWKKSLPLLHILALLTRNYYPVDRRIEFSSIMGYLKSSRRWAALSTIQEIVENGGELPDKNVNQGDGITNYHYNLQAKRRGGSQIW